MTFAVPRYRKHIAKQRRARIDYSRLKYPKVAPERNPAYLHYVRDQLCAAHDVDCQGITEAAHLFVLGRGIKAGDFYTVPLCSAHHGEQHSVGTAYFQLAHNVNLWEVAMRLLVDWVRKTS